jgi:hypothetical protein
VINFNPRGTGGLREVITGARGVAVPGGHGTMDPHAPASDISLFQTDDVSASFTAGVIHAFLIRRRYRKEVRACVMAQRLRKDPRKPQGSTAEATGGCAP